MVETLDGGLFAFMSVPDMALPILSALTYPESAQTPSGGLILKAWNFSFRAHDAKRFPALLLCMKRGVRGARCPRS